MSYMYKLNEQIHLNTYLAHIYKKIMNTDTIQQKNINPTPPLKVDVLEPWLNTPYKCVHCGEVFKKGLPALRGHLGHCKSRLLNRFFVVGRYLFAVKCNPLKRKILSADEEIKETHDAKVFLGLLKGFQRYGLIQSFSVTELPEWSNTNPLFSDGIVSFGTLKKKLSPANMQMFKSDIEKQLNSHINIQEETNSNKEV